MSASFLGSNVVSHNTGSPVSVRYLRPDRGGGASPGQKITEAADELQTVSGLPGARAIHKRAGWRLMFLENDNDNDNHGCAQAAGL